MKLSLVVLAVFLGVAASSPLNKRVDDLLENLLETLEKRGKPHPAPLAGKGRPGHGKPGLGHHGKPGGKNDSSVEEPLSEEGSVEIEDEPLSASQSLESKESAESAEKKKPNKRGSGKDESNDSEEKDARRDEKEAEEDITKGSEGMMGAHIWAKVCKVNLTQEYFMTQVNLNDVKYIFTGVYKIFSTLAKKFDGHKEILAKIASLKANDNTTAHHEKLMEEFSKIPDKDLMKELMCTLGKIKLVLTRAKFNGVSKKDFPEAQNCLDTCGQLMKLVPSLSEGKLPAVNISALKKNVERDYNCLKSQVLAVKAGLEKGLQEKEKPKAFDVLTIIGTIEHVIEGLGNRGSQMLGCASTMKHIHQQQEAMNKKKSASGGKAVRELLAALRSF